MRAGTSGRLVIWLVASASVLAVVLGGCARDDSGPGVASAGGGTGGPGGPSSSASVSAGDSQEQALQFARCMRENGVDMPDPEAGGRGSKLLLPGGRKTDPKVQAAIQACQQYLPGGGTPKSLNPETIDGLLKYTQCLRAQGISVSDPDPNTGEIAFGGNGRDKLSVLNDPKFKAAQTACQNQLPGGKGAGK